ncbi:hypothetical protein BN130_3461 [Cronobacter malonaticus 507]|nr:hypothetical protein BN130_3461 [Cronobacter malonaticus 507]
MVHQPLHQATLLRVRRGVNGFDGRQRSGIGPAFIFQQRNQRIPVHSVFLLSIYLCR